ncbi:MAG: 50S ribosomal protein L15 [Myxococcales bacterium]|nr:50S ribosomal protein L15 [Myxococcales bacterium]
MSILSKLKPPAGSKKKKFRVGRGVGSGNGKTAGRGQKGQGARSGTGGRLHFEGGQIPIYRRLPKRGFKNILRDVVVNVNVGQLEAFDAGTEVTVEALRERGLVKGQFDALKVLGDGELSKKLTVKAHAFSASAAAKIEKAGGTAEVVSRSAAAKASEGSESAE